MTHSITRPPMGASLPTMKYSLPELLAEIEAEKKVHALAVDKLEQGDIGKLFQAQPKRRRGKSS